VPPQRASEAKTIKKTLKKAKVTRKNLKYFGAIYPLLYVILYEGYTPYHILIEPLFSKKFKYIYLCAFSIKLWFYKWEAVLL